MLILRLIPNLVGRDEHEIDDYLKTQGMAKVLPQSYLVLVMMEAR